MQFASCEPQEYPKQRCLNDCANFEHECHAEMT